MTSQRGVPVGKQKRDIWNIECTDSAVSARHSRNPATGCIKCTKCSVITSLTGRMVGNSAREGGRTEEQGDSSIAEPPNPPRVIFEIGLLGATSIPRIRRVRRVRRVPAPVKIRNWERERIIVRGANGERSVVNRVRGMRRLPEGLRLPGVARSEAGCSDLRIRERCIPNELYASLIIASKLEC